MGGLPASEEIVAVINSRRSGVNDDGAARHGSGGSYALREQPLAGGGVFIDGDNRKTRRVLLCRIRCSLERARHRDTTQQAEFWSFRRRTGEKQAQPDGTIAAERQYPRTKRASIFISHASGAHTPGSMPAPAGASCPRL